MYNIELCLGSDGVSKSQFGALSALRECLAAAASVVVARYAHVTFEALAAALESDTTSPKLLQPLLAALMQVCSASISGCLGPARRASTSSSGGRNSSA